ncbi:ribonuclease HI [Buchnera aphidicola]|uniref:Ribonuclease H n=1 Tax=Buchnera aphidicola subsp. Tuberolachnus salignus TaxID=98804 RepID=A0A160SWH5_BUCTT|nr:ribonuclease HI [Buchnera aphidicola]CUR53142.1 Ribonuclease HI [Buchnera aphidicola (Tuberolachnus salignus)]
MKKKIQMFTDGSCLKNPGSGGFCVIIKYFTYQKIISKGFYLTTNNRMELMAAIYGFKALKEKCNVTITTDSQYLRKGILFWYKNWEKNNWKKKNKNKIKNKDLWILLHNLLNSHKIKWIWTKGHIKNTIQNLCDIIARKEAKNPKYYDKKYQFKKK